MHVTLWAADADLMLKLTMLVCMLEKLHRAQLLWTEFRESSVIPAGVILRSANGAQPAMSPRTIRQSTHHRPCEIWAELVESTCQGTSAQQVACGANSPTHHHIIQARKFDTKLFGVVLGSFDIGFRVVAIHSPFASPIIKPSVQILSCGAH